MSGVFYILLGYFSNDTKAPIPCLSQRLHHLMKTLSKKLSCLPTTQNAAILFSKFLEETNGTKVGWLVGFYGISTFVGYVFNAKSIFIQIISSISNNSV